MLNPTRVLIAVAVLAASLIPAADAFARLASNHNETLLGGTTRPVPPEPSRSRRGPPSGWRQAPPSRRPHRR